MKKFLIVGLGHIGEKYANTRHNIGFQFLDALAKDQDVKFEYLYCDECLRIFHQCYQYQQLKIFTYYLNLLMIVF